MNSIKRWRGIFYYITILIILINFISVTYAATTDELQQQQKEIDSRIAETSSEIAAKKSEMSAALNQITKLNSQISDYQYEINVLEGQINTLDIQISEKEAGIKEQEEKFEVQNELLEKRLIAMYETGTTTYLDMLLSSDGLSDFISNYYLISQLAEADEELLERIEKTREQIESEKVALETYKSEIETTRSEAESKKSTLASSVNSKNALVNNLSAEEKELEEQLEEYEKEKRDVQSKLAALSKNYTGAIVAPSAAGYTSPLPGKTKANITTGFYGYSGHTGSDFACSAGTPVLAVKAGKVVISKASMRNGVYTSYGEYVAIDHNDGTVTLYAHMLAGSRQVSEGQHVSQGQQIGQVGSTGRSTGNHLHFEVRVGGKAVNPAPYLP